MLFRPGIRPYVFVPLAINVLLFALLAWLMTSRFEGWLDWLIPPDSWYDFLRWLLWPIFALTLILILFQGFTTLANLIGAPFNSMLALRVEQSLGGNIHATRHDTSILRETLPSLANELRKQAYFLSRALLLLLLFLIPVMAPLAPVLWFLFSAWMLALEYLDYPMANHHIDFRRQRRLVAKRRAGALWFGALLTGLMMIPGLNLLSMPIGVVGATLYWHERFKAIANASERNEHRDSTTLRED